jgi:tetratricopeptide (TPR) repeat protein
MHHRLSIVLEKIYRLAINLSCHRNYVLSIQIHGRHVMKVSGYALIIMIVTVLLPTIPVYGDSAVIYYYDRGVEIAAQGKFAEAKITFQQALELDPQSNPVQRCMLVLTDVEKQRIKEQTAIHLFRGFSLFNHYKINEAIQELSKAIELDDQYAVSYSHRAGAYADKQHFKEAFADYNKAIELNPGYSAAYLNRGNLYVQTSDLDKAIADYSRAIEIEPRNILGYYNRGNAYSKQGRYEQAIAEYKILLEIDPLFPHAYTGMGLVFEKTDRPRDALAIYNAYLEKLDLKKQNPQQVKWVQDKVKSLDK